MYTIDQLQAIQNNAMAQHLGQKATLKTLATTQGKAAMKKLMDNENVDLYDVVKAVLTDGPAILSVNLNEIQRLVQENKLPNNDNILNEVFDYIESHLIHKKTQYYNYLIDYKHGLKPDEIEYAQTVIQNCDDHSKDINKLKKKIKWEYERSTRPSVFDWVRNIMFHEWGNCTMHDNRKEYDHVLKPILPRYTAPSQPKTKTPKKEKPRKPQSKKPKAAKIAGTTMVGRTVCFDGAPKKTLDVFDKICYFYNWRYEGCRFSDDKCKKEHICSEEGCGSTKHPAHEHK